MCLLRLKMIIVTVNVALNKPAHQQYPFKTNYSIGDASNAVDGQKSNLTKNSGHCVLSADTETATLWVNLTSIHNIENVTIYFMTDNKQYGMFYFFFLSFYFLQQWLNWVYYVNDVNLIKIHLRIEENLHFFFKKINIIWLAP